MSSGPQNQGDKKDGPPKDAPKEQPKEQERTQERTRAFIPAPFIVECGDDRNRGRIPLDHLRLWLRGRWLKSLFSRDEGSLSLGEMNKMPDIPGIRIEVNARDSKLRIFDPLEKMPALMEKINDVIGDIGIIRNQKPKKHWPEVVHTITEDEMKSVLMEIARKVHAPSDQYCMFVVTGTVPTLEQVKSAAGRELFDPWSNSVDKPKYVDQFQQWSDRWEQMLLGRSAMAMMNG